MPQLTFTNMMLWVYLTTLAPRVVARLLQFIGLPSLCYTSATAWECQQGCLKIAHSTSISPRWGVRSRQIWQEFSACPYQACMILSPDTKSWILGPLPTPRTFTFPERVSGKMNKRMRGVINSEPIFNVVLKINFFRMHNLWTEGVHLCSIERGVAACNMQWYRGRCGAPQGEGKWREQMIAQWGGGKGQTLHIRLQSKQNVLVYLQGIVWAYQRVTGINHVSGLATFWTVLYRPFCVNAVCHVDYKWG